MGRIQNPIPNPRSATGRLAQHLRDGLAHRDLSYRELANAVGYHPTTLQRAADGRRVPSWGVVKDFALGCGLHTEEVRVLWAAARAERHGRGEAHAVPGVEQIYNYADLGVVLANLREQKGSPSFRVMEKRAEDSAERFGSLPHSTAQRIAVRKTRPSLRQLHAFLVGLGIPVQQHSALVRAWQRADARYQADHAQEAAARHASDLALLQADLAIAEQLSMQDIVQLVRGMGFSPVEDFRGYTRPWSVYCEWCRRAMRIRLDWEVRRLRRSDGTLGMYCRDCSDGLRPRTAPG